MDSSEKKTREKLLGNKSRVDAEFPIGLKMILKKLSFYSPPSMLYIIEKHTFLNFCRNVLNRNEINKIMDVLSNGKKRVLLLINDKQFFQYCQKCLEEDYENFGESYWRLSFQLPTVFICNKHNELLSFSNIRYNTGALHPVDRENCSNFNNKKVTKKTLFHLKRFAEQSLALNKEDMKCPPEDWIKIYFSLLNKRGYLNKKGMILNRRLIKDIVFFYGIEFLSIFNINIDRMMYRLQKFHWLNNLNIKEKLVLILFLTKSFKEFCKEPFVINKMNETFLCENLFCNQKGTVKEIMMVENYYNVEFQFKCSCGFVYKKILHDQFNEKVPTEVIRYGEVWSNELYHLAYEKNLSTAKIANILKCSQFEVEELLLTKKINRYPADIEKRKHWLKIIGKFPNADIAEIRHQNFTLYSWLYQYDYDWLYRHFPRFYYKTIYTGEVFWNKRDKDLKWYLKDHVSYLIKSGYSSKEIKHRLVSKCEVLDLDLEADFLPKVRKYLRNIIGINVY